MVVIWWMAEGTAMWMTWCLVGVKTTWFNGVVKRMNVHVDNNNILWMDAVQFVKFFINPMCLCLGPSIHCLSMLLDTHGLMPPA